MFFEILQMGVETFSFFLGLGIREVQQIFCKKLQMISLILLWSMILRYRNQSIDYKRTMVGALPLSGIKYFVVG